LHAITDFPYQPIDLIEWVQLRAKAITSKVLIVDGNAQIHYEMELIQRIERVENKNAIRITGKFSDPDASSNFETKTGHLRFGVKELFRVLMPNCQSFTDDDIPDKLWQEAEYGINQPGNDSELEHLLNYKIFKNLEVVTHPALRNFFEVGREKPLPPRAKPIDLMNSADRDQNEDFLMGRPSSFGNMNDDKGSSSSMRWPTNILPANYRLSKTRGWIAEQQFDSYRAASIGSRVEASRGNNTIAAHANPNEFTKNTELSVLTSGLFSKKGMLSDSLLEQSVLPRPYYDEFAEQGSSPGNDFRL